MVISLQDMMLYTSYNVPSHNAIKQHRTSPDITHCNVILAAYHVKTLCLYRKVSMFTKSDAQDTCTCLSLPLCTYIYIYTFVPKFVHVNQHTQKHTHTHARARMSSDMGTHLSELFIMNIIHAYSNGGATLPLTIAPSFCCNPRTCYVH